MTPLPERPKCQHVNRKRLPYLDAHADAEKRLARGERQVRCPKCGLYFWPRVK